MLCCLFPNAAQLFAKCYALLLHEWFQWKLERCKQIVCHTFNKININLMKLDRFTSRFQQIWFSNLSFWIGQLFANVCQIFIVTLHPQPSAWAAPSICRRQASGPPPFPAPSSGIPPWRSWPAYMIQHTWGILAWKSWMYSPFYNP